MTHNNSNNQKKLEKKVIEKRKKILKKYSKVKNHRTMLSFCPKCGYESYELSKYCICCGHKCEINYDWFEVLLVEIIHYAHFKNNKLCQEITEDEIKVLKDDKYFKEKCNNDYEGLFYIFSKSKYGKHMTIKMLTYLHKLDEVFRFLILKNFKHYILDNVGYHSKEENDWIGYTYLIGCDSLDISDIDLVHLICYSDIDKIRGWELVRKEPNYNLIKDYWDSHADGKLPIRSYGFATIELVDGIYKAYNLGKDKGIKCPKFEDCTNKELLFKLYDIIELVEHWNGGNYYMRKLLLLIENMQLDSFDEISILNSGFLKVF